MGSYVLARYALSLLLFVAGCATKFDAATRTKLPLRDAEWAQMASAGV